MKSNVFVGKLGIEKESLRVDGKGNLAHTPHPFMDTPNIDRDFCENQIEIITNVNNSVDEVYEELKKWHNMAVKRLYTLETGKEYIWNCSNPPYVKSEEDVPIAKFHGRMKGKELYRQYLSKKYGRKKMLFSGIHFNYSFDEEYIDSLCKNSCKKFKDKNGFYLSLAKNLTQYAWFIVYLTAASPLMDGSYLKKEDLGQDILTHYSSARCSEIGYWNDFIPVLDYSNLDSYVESIEEYVNSEQLKSTSELYCPVRLKPNGENTLDNLKENGINHIEFRSIDLNPLSDIGLMKEDVLFLQLFMIYLSDMPNEEFLEYQQIAAIKNVKNAAKFKVENIDIETGWDENKNIVDAAAELINNIEEFYKNLFAQNPDLENENEVMNNLRFQREKIDNPKNRYAVKIMKAYENNYVGQGLSIIKEYANRIMK